MIKRYFLSIREDVENNVSESSDGKVDMKIKKAPILIPQSELIFKKR